MLLRSFRGLLRPGSALHAAYTTASERPLGLDLQGTIGFIGVGNMGAPMAANLLRAGLPVLVFDRNPEAVKKLTQLGATSADSPQQIGETPGVTAVISMLPSTEHVTDAYEGRQGLLRAAGGIHPSLIIDCSTILPTYTSKLAATIANNVQLAAGARKVPGAAGPVFADAPVSGGVPGAVAGSLTFMVGGSSVAVRAALPLLQLMGKRIEHLGDPGAGQVAKICNNLAMAIQMAGVSEALALGAAAGLDPAKLSAVFNSSSARCWSSDSYNPVPGVMPDVPSSHNFQGGFNVSLMSKDLRLAMQLAISCKQPFHMSEAVSRLYQQVLDSTKEPLDFSAIYKFVYKGRPSSHINNRPAEADDAAAGGSGDAATSGGGGSTSTSSSSSSSNHPH